MPKSYRIKVKPNQDKNIFVNLEQDFDQLEILSLKIVKSDVYSRTCADYGVIVGRAQANGGFGIPNAKISIFVPITDEDAEDEVISQLYPYRQITDKNEEGYRYNLLPKTSESCNHVATGNFFTPEEVINNPVILEVFEKYYKYTTKTNESGDYMLWGVPLGNQTIHASIDVSDIGCYSMRPYQFIRNGESPSRFENSLTFKSSENLDTLPQIALQNKAVQVVPFWGDETLCGVGITRVDFDLRDSGIEIEPSATFMGSIITDDDNNYVSTSGVPSKQQGQLCNLTTGTGYIESIRHTVFKEDDGCTTKLEKFNLDNGGKVIDGNGTWVTQLPMNLDYVVTNEFGQKVISDDPRVGIPTKAKYRFRISFDSPGGEVRSGRYLVPNIRQYEGADLEKSYNFSVKLEDYPGVQQPEDIYGSPANKCTDYFYEFLPNRVYSVASFIDNYRKNIGNGDFNKTANSRWRFLGIKTINPPAESRCTDITKEFPVNDAFRGGTTTFSTLQVTRLLQVITITIAALLVGFQLISIVTQYASLCLQSAKTISLVTVGTIASASVINLPVGVALISNFLVDFIVGVILLVLSAIFLYGPMGQTLIRNFFIVRSLYNYPNCEPCFCGGTFRFEISYLFDLFVDDGDVILPETIGDDPNSTNNCNQERYMRGFGLKEPDGGGNGNAYYWRGMDNNYPIGCYALEFLPSVLIIYLAALILLGVSAAIPFNVGAVLIHVFNFTGVLALLIACLDSVYRMFRSLNQWRILSNIYTGLCEGVFNMKFSNNWINGTLYFPKFMVKKLKVNQETGQPEPDDNESKYSKDILYKSENGDNGESFYYYRSCPFSPSVGFTSQNPQPDELTPTGAFQHKGINFPTTIVDLGPLDPCITELCKEQEGIDSCLFIDKLKPSSFQPTEELLGMIVERKITAIDDYYQFVWSDLNKWFGADSRPGVAFDRNLGNTRLGSNGDLNNPGPYRNRVIDGDIAQLLASNNQIGVSVFTVDDSDPYYGTDSDWYYSYGANAANGDYENETVITDVSTPFSLVPNNTDLINCVQGGTFGIPQTQVVPYYAWRPTNPSYGTFNNDYEWNVISFKGYQQGLAYSAPNDDISTWERPEYYEDGQPVPPLAYYQNIVDDTPISPTSPSSFRLGTGMYFYFGLRQGASAYDRFINEYLPPKDDESEL